MRRVAALLAVLAAIVATPSSALAGGDSAGSSEDTIWVNPVAPGESAGGGGPGGSVPCDYQAIPESAANPDDAQGVKVINGVTHYLFYQDCNDGLAIGPVWVPELRPEDLIPTVQGLLEEQLHYPTPVLQPLDAEFGWAYVQVPLDFRVEPGEWAPVEAYAEATNPLGTVWVQATATPLELSFTSGDGPASCGGQEPLEPYLPEQPGACSFVYRNASSTVPGSTFTGGLAIAWEASWVSSDPAQFGTLDVGPTETLFDIAVAEAKALVSCAGAGAARGDC